MIEDDHERAAALCRQAALPILRHRQRILIPEAPGDKQEIESGTPPPAPAASRREHAG